MIPVWFFFWICDFICFFCGFLLWLEYYLGTPRSFLKTRPSSWRKSPGPTRWRFLFLSIRWWFWTKPLEKYANVKIGSSPRVIRVKIPQIFELPPPRYSSNNSTLNCAWKSMPRVVYHRARWGCFSLSKTLVNSSGACQPWKMVWEPGHVVVRNPQEFISIHTCV